MKKGLKIGLIGLSALGSLFAPIIPIREKPMNPTNEGSEVLMMSSPLYLISGKRFGLSLLFANHVLSTPNRTLFRVYLGKKLLYSNLDWDGVY